MLPYIFAFDCNAVLIFSVGVDRLFSILYATQCVMCLFGEVVFYLARHNAWNRKRYVSLLTLPALALAATQESIAYVEIRSDNRVVPYCYPPAALAPKGAGLWVAVNVVICIAVVCVYVAAYRAVKRQPIAVKKQAFVKKIKEGFAQNSASKHGSNTRHHTLQSLMIIVVVYVISWVILVLGQGVVRVFGRYWA